MSDSKNSSHKPAEIDLSDVEAFSMQHCPIIQQANQVLRSSKETQRALRRFQESLMNCDVCLAIDRCELREHFNIQVDRAIAEVLEEWGW
jgi:hypothetical protein